MQQEQANDFYERIVEGTDYLKEIQLEHSSGATLDGVEMHPVEKQTLANTIQNLPEDMFAAVEEADSPEEAEEMMEDQGADMSVGAMGEEVVEAFERLVTESLSHPDLTDTQMEHIVGELDFGLLFELGSEVIDMSFAEGGAVKDFREQA